MNLENEKKKEKERVLNLMSENTATNSILGQEEAQRKMLIDDMVKNSSPSDGPVVRVVTHNQGNEIIYQYIFACTKNLSIFFPYHRNLRENAQKLGEYKRNRPGKPF